MASFVCVNCGNEFENKRSDVNLEKPVCNKKCFNEYRWVCIMKRIEENVGEECYSYLFNRYLVDLKPTRFIAQESLGNKNSYNTISKLLKMFGIPIRTGSEAVKTQWIENEERRKQQSEYAKNELSVGESRENLIKIMQTKEYRLKSSLAKRGENNPMYGIRGEDNPRWDPKRTHAMRQEQRKTFEYKEWRTNVFTRDNRICQCCGYEKGHILVAHHMNSWHWYEEGRYDVNNGVTLCEPCHKEFHYEYGQKNNTKEQFKEFLIKKNIVIPSIL